jgi:hypothetical protein
MAGGLDGIPSMASAANAFLLALLLILRHILLPRLSPSQQRMIEAPVVMLTGFFVLYVIANFLSAVS